MEATLIKMGESVGFRIPESFVNDFSLKAGTRVNMNFSHDKEFAFSNLSKVREGWDVAFAQYAMNGEDKQMLPDFFDTETDSFL